MFEKKTLNVYSIIIGTFFLVSGAGKVIDTAGFSNLIYEYGLGKLMLLSPVIVLTEILLGLFLIFLIKPKRYSFIAFILLLVFTGAFAYGHFVNGVNNCGCFGTLHETNLPPIFSFIRNFILIGMSYILWIKYPGEETEISKWKKNLILAVMGISIFIAGFTFKTPSFLAGNTESHKFQNQHISTTALSKYIKPSQNSTYLVFCFSYTCPYCLNSIENLRQYQKTHTVDSVIVFAVGGASDKLVFEKNFHPDFAIHDLSNEAMDELTKSYPTAFYVEHDTVKVVVQAELPSAFIFKKMNHLFTSKQ